MSFITLDKLLQSWAYYLQQCSWIVRAQIQSNISSIIVISFRLENVRRAFIHYTFNSIFGLHQLQRKISCSGGRSSSDGYHIKHCYLIKCYKTILAIAASMCA